MKKIGIPRALLYHYYYPCWQTFFRELGMEVIISPETNKKILDQGVKVAVDDICLPFKVFYGHVLELLDCVDYLFVPRFISLGKNNFVCPKFMGLPDMVEATFNNHPPLIKPDIDLRWRENTVWELALQIGRDLGIGFWRTNRAYLKSVAIQKKHDSEIHFDHNIDCITDYKIDFNTEGNKDQQKGFLKIAIIGHAYLVYDRLISMDIIGNLQRMGVQVLTIEMFNKSLVEQAASYQSKKLFWLFNRQVMGAAYHLIFNQQSVVDGIVELTAFGCGPDSLVKELIDIKGRKTGKAILSINLDEHSGQAGLLTRLEAFVDLLERRSLA